MRKGLIRIDGLFWVNDLCWVRTTMGAKSGKAGEQRDKCSTKKLRK